MTEMKPCGDCGMPCDPAEYHPLAACVWFKACHNGDVVRAKLKAFKDEAAQTKADERGSAQPEDVEEFKRRLSDFAIAAHRKEAQRLCVLRDVLVSMYESHAETAPAWDDKPNFCARCGKRLGAGVHTCSPPRDEPPLTTEQAFEAGWNLAADWAGRDDLHVDVTSQAYISDRDEALRAAMSARPQGD